MHAINPKRAKIATDYCYCIQVNRKTDATSRRENMSDRERGRQTDRQTDRQRESQMCYTKIHTLSSYFIYGSDLFYS